ncbi:sel1 repeat family protein [Neorhizobium galegae]|uniref:tetratricopeptide repeat protein n=1 Tax=Neorhizobium galegae TaxID=399 RepID=UPI002101C9F8|nr:tetratricopeptide repeat protein [Neorhizobium galegae]MCQ1571605.1 sel1 repeat family protein [Neorhizobium galegae]MCQ1837770.1 sel1 repeat family protein [Neorhizobium galegae]
MYPDIAWDKEPDLNGLKQALELMNMDFLKGVAALEQLADDGSIASMFYLADAYGTDRFQSKDLQKAEYWFSRSNDAGWRHGAFMLARLLYDRGDYPAAFGLFRGAAENDHVPATFWTGYLLSRGEGTTRDEQYGFTLMENAASRGHLTAKRKLIGMYFRGRSGNKGFLRGLWMVPSLIADMAVIIFRGSWRSQEFNERIM